MKKDILCGGRVHVYKKGTNKSQYTMHYILFDPSRRVVTGDEAKALANKVMKISKKRLKEEYDVVYAMALKDRMDKQKVTIFKTCLKLHANCIFVIPKKYRKEARKEIGEFFVFGYLGCS